jgi:hypothetical protein
LRASGCSSGGVLGALPETELVRRQEAILSAGYFEAFNYWLFRGARAEEFSEWIKSHHDQFQAWLDWQTKNMGYRATTIVNHA